MLVILEVIDLCMIIVGILLLLIGLSILAFRLSKIRWTLTFVIIGFYTVLSLGFCYLYIVMGEIAIDAVRIIASLLPSTIILYLGILISRFFTISYIFSGLSGE